MASFNKSIQSMSTENHAILISDCLTQQMTIPTAKTYPYPICKHEDVVAADCNLFKDILEIFHTDIGINSEYPKIESEELDLKLLYIEVTSRGGLIKVIKKNKWEQVSLAFKFKSTPDNLSTLLQRHYTSLLWHFEQVYFFRKQDHLIPPPTMHAPKPISNPPANASAAKGKRKATGSAIQHANKRKRKAATDSAIPHADKGKKKATDSAANSTSSGSDFVSGVITGKCKDAYFVSIIVGSETLRGILYHPANTDHSA